MDISDAKLPISASTVRIKGHFSADSIINQAVCCRNFKEYKFQLILIFKKKINLHLDQHIVLHTVGCCYHFPLVLAIFQCYLVPV